LPIEAPALSSSSGPGTAVLDAPAAAPAVVPVIHTRPEEHQIEKDMPQQGSTPTRLPDWLTWLVLVLLAVGVALVGQNLFW
jgi:hypothetical protein